MAKITIVPRNGANITFTKVTSWVVNDPFFVMEGNEKDHWYRVNEIEFITFEDE